MHSTSKQCALFVGATAGKVDSMKYLIDTYNSDPSLRNELSNTPLHVAAAYKRPLVFSKTHLNFDPNIKGPLQIESFTLC